MLLDVRAAASDEAQLGSIVRTRYFEAETVEPCAESRVVLEMRPHQRLETRRGEHVDLDRFLPPVGDSRAQHHVEHVPHDDMLWGIEPRSETGADRQRPTPGDGVTRDTTLFIAKVCTLVRDHKPDAVFVDATGVGGPVAGLGPPPD